MSSLAVPVGVSSSASWPDFWATNLMAVRWSCFSDGSLSSVTQLRVAASVCSERRLQRLVKEILCVLSGGQGLCRRQDFLLLRENLGRGVIAGGRRVFRGG